jgi:hypothetical protein
MRTSFGILALTVVSNIALAQSPPPYAGKWKLNPAKSDFGQLTVGYEALAGGGYKVTMGGQSYTLSADGKESSTPWGSMIAGKQIDANTFATVNRVNGKVFSIDTARVSADGRTLTVDSKITRPEGPSASERMTLQRIGNGSGLAGRWQAKAVTSNAPARMSITAQDNGLLLRFDDEDGECNARFDGKEVPATGSMWSAGWTCSIARSGAGAFDFSMQREGKLTYKSSFTASADGKTLTETGGLVGTNEKVKLVYDKQ